MELSTYFSRAGTNVREAYVIALVVDLKISLPRNFLSYELFLMILILGSL